MRKLTLTLIAASLTACTVTPEMIAAQKDRCTSLGYTPGSIEHAQCARANDEEAAALQETAEDDMAHAMRDRQLGL